MELLSSALKKLQVETWSVGACAELEQLILQTWPHLIFTDLLLPDGSWVDVLNTVERVDVPVNVIVVGSAEHADTKLYASILERGAFDLVLPPFERRSLELVVKLAGTDARHRRQALVLAAASRAAPAWN
jgi:DNA-binding NtrC family response regulator